MKIRGDYSVDYKNIEGLIRVLSESNLTYLEITEGDTKILLKKEENKEFVLPNAQNAQDKMQKEMIIQEPLIKHELVETNENEGQVILAPIVGTVYLSPSPDSEAFVKVGDKISKGQTVCIIEAMKLMNEIQSDFDGIVEEVLVDNMEMVEYGQSIIKIK